MMTLVMLVCGCVVDGDCIHGEEQDEGTVVIECPFCGISFSLTDLADFSAENKFEIRGFMLMAIRAPRPLIRYLDEAFEVHEICNCGYPIVSKAKDKDDKPHHLRVPPVDTVRLLD
jgi:hypothetical protein